MPHYCGTPEGTLEHPTNCKGTVKGYILCDDRS